MMYVFHSSRMFSVFGVVWAISFLQNAAADADVKIIIVSPNGEEIRIHREDFHLAFTSWLRNVTYSRIKLGISYGICSSKRQISDFIRDIDGIKFTVLQLLRALSFGDFAYCKLLLEIAENHKQPSEVFINWLRSGYDFPRNDMFQLVKNAKIAEDNFNLSYPKHILDTVVYIAERYSLFEKAIAENEFILGKWLLNSGYKLSNISSGTIKLLMVSGEQDLLKKAIENIGEKALCAMKNVHQKDNKFLEFLIKFGFTEVLDNLLSSNAVNAALVLSKAIEMNNSKIIEKYKGEILFTDKKYFPILLHSAVSGGLVEFVKKLLELGAPLEAVDDVGKTPLYKALELKENEIIDVLIRSGANYKTPTVLGKSLLSTAVVLRDIDVARRLIELNASCLQPDADGLTPLQKAIENNDKGMVTILSDSLNDTNIVTFDGKSLIHIAVLSGSSEVLEKLLERGAAVDLSDKDQNTPLCLAAETTDKIKILHLAVYEANINHECAFGNTPLHIAILKKSFSVVRVLVALGANVNIANHDGHSPLYIAAVTNNPEIIKYLSSKRGDLYFLTKKGDTLVHAAAAHGSTEALDTLVELGINVNATNNAGESPIYVSVKFNKPLSITLLASKHANVHELTPNEDTLLHVAVDFDSIDSMITLLKLGLSPETLNKMGQSAINKAILSNSYEMVWKMINNAVSLVFSINMLLLAASSGNLESLRALNDYLNVLKIKTRWEDPETGRTPLSEAVKGNHDDVVRFLIKEGDDIYFKSRKGDTLMHLAAINGSTETVRVLYEFGLPFDSPNKKGETPLWLAVKYGHFDATMLLYDLGADIHVRCLAHWANASLLLPAAFSGNERIVSWLLFEGFFIEDADILGVTALQEAASGGRDKVVQLLLDNGADADKADINGMTPLHKAAYNGHTIVAEKLVTYGASLNVQAVNFLTPLHQAATNGHLDIVRLLCNHKADMNAQDARGWTSMHWAAYRGHANVVRELVTSGADTYIKSIDGMTPLQIAKSRKHKGVETVLNAF